jgi:hypothetical protein
MTLSQKQRLFTFLVSKLIDYAYTNGYEIALGYAFRCQDCKVGKANSNHKICLAVDLNLFRDGKYLTETADHERLGKFWESLHPLCSWGGHFNDGNHYSLEHNGRR